MPCLIRFASVLIFVVDVGHVCLIQGFICKICPARVGGAIGAGVRGYFLPNGGGSWGGASCAPSPEVLF